MRRYVPNELTKDTTTYQWASNGVVSSVRVPSFACPEIELVKSAVESLFDQSQNGIDDWLSLHYHDNAVMRETCMEATRYRGKYGSKLLECALKLQHGTILSQGAGSVTEESLKMLLGELDCDDISKRKAYDADDAGQARPIPLAMQHQIETAILMYINQVQVDLRKALERRFLQPKPKPWYEIFLTVFILLQNMRWVYSGALRYRKMCEETVRRPILLSFLIW
jgi:hypothetical protein